MCKEIALPILITFWRIVSIKACFKTIDSVFFFLAFSHALDRSLSPRGRLFSPVPGFGLFFGAHSDIKTAAADSHMIHEAYDSRQAGKKKDPILTPFMTPVGRAIYRL